MEQQAAELCSVAEHASMAMEGGQTKVAVGMQGAAFALAALDLTLARPARISNTCGGGGACEWCTACCSGSGGFVGGWCGWQAGGQHSPH